MEHRHGQSQNERIQRAAVAEAQNRTLLAQLVPLQSLRDHLHARQVQDRRRDEVLRQHRQPIERRQHAPLQQIVLHRPQQHTRQRHHHARQDQKQHHRKRADEPRHIVPHQLQACPFLPDHHQLAVLRNRLKRLNLLLHLRADVLAFARVLEIHHQQLRASIDVATLRIRPLRHRAIQLNQDVELLLQTLHVARHGGGSFLHFHRHVFPRLNLLRVEATLDR